MVVFGRGGFTQDATKSFNFLRGPIFAGCGVPTCTGDFVEIGIALGAEIGNMNQAWWLQCPLELALKSPVLTGADVWMPWGDSMVIVNKYGDRIMSEKITYNERGQTHHIWRPDRREYPNLVQFMIYDDAVAQDPVDFPFRFPIPAAGDDSDYVIKGNTWEELATNISDRLDSLRGQGSVSARVGPDVKLADNFVDRLGATIDQGAPWSCSSKVPRVALTERTVVTKRFGPLGPSLVNLGKLWRPSLNVSTVMCQSATSTSSTIRLRLTIVHQGT